jgi:preprotein translocase subunit SecD
MVKERLDALVDDVRSTLRPERIGYRSLGVHGNVVAFTLTDPAGAPRALELLQKLDQSAGLSHELVVQQVGDGRIEIRLTDDAVREMQRAAVTQSLEIVRRPSSARATTASWCRCRGKRTRRASSACSARPPS